MKSASSSARRGCPGCCSRRRWRSSRVFFFWPAGAGDAAVAAAAGRVRHAPSGSGCANFERIFSRPELPRVVQDDGGLLGAGGRASASASRCVLAVFADRVVRGAIALQDAADLALCGGARGGRRAVAVHVRAERRRRRRTRCAQPGIDWNHLLDANHAMALIVMAAVWKQISYNFLFFLAGLQSIPKSLIEAAAIDGAAAVAALLDDPVPAAVADHLLPARDQRRLRLLRHLRHHRRGDRGRARARTPRSWSTRSTTTASRRSTSAARRRSRWC